MKHIKLIPILWFFLMGHITWAQQEAQFTQYMYNPVLVNPAYAGSRGYLSINGLYRSQWAGLDGAPKTMAFSAHDDFGKVGLGLSVLNDQIGPATENNITADFSYSLPISTRGAQWAFGLKAGIHTFELDFQKLQITDPTEPILNAERNKMATQIGVGTFIYAEKWYLGLSTPNLLQTQYYDNNSVSTATERAHFYFLGGYVFDLSPNLKFKPATMVKMVSGSSITADLSANFMIQETLTLGAAYRFGNSVSGLLALQPTKKLLIGYAYDFDTSQLRRYNSGSHELFIRFEIFGKECDCAPISPRFF